MIPYITSIHFTKYKRFENQDISFSPGINAIAGTNGTCKSSLLHIISNSYQDCFVKMARPEASTCLTIINSILNDTNPKIESLNRGDKENNDPAPGVTNYYTCYYEDGISTPFRKHASKINNRYAVKPYYKKGSHEKLKCAMIAYLGINRLFPFGEFKDDESLSQVKRELPDKYKETIRELYKEFTGYDISGLAAQKMGLIKNRYEFHSKTKGVDSNTISAGEDNLLILITTIICLSYFRDSLKPEFSQTPIIMLIDEFDATLHPEFQIKLVNTLYKLSKSHNIQVIFTTHSISLLDYMLDMKMNVIYMKDDVQRISVVEDIDKYKLEQYLKNELASSIYIDRNIPVFSEDNETREFIEILFNSTHDDSFSKAKSHLHLVEASIGADVLRQIFKNDPVSKTSIHSICILDGDQNPDIRDCIISLPGGKNPEEICFEYATELFNNTDENATIFWNEVENRTTITKHYFDMNIRPNITYESRKSAVTDNHKLREVNKELFNKYPEFYQLVIQNWVNNPNNQVSITAFFSDLKAAFKRVAIFHNINPKMW